MNRSSYLEDLLTLHMEPTPEARLRSFRQGIASLGLTTSTDGPSPFEGLDTEALAKSIAVASSDGLLNSLSWLSPTAEAIALYEIAVALPPGVAQRELQRRALTHLYEGNAATFVAIATRMLLRGAQGGISEEAVDARVRLALTLPGRADIEIGPLALALVSQRALAREWIEGRGTRSLPDRRLAARLIESAALEATRRAARGGTEFLRMFRSVFTSEPAPGFEALRTGWHALLADREGLVWRHVAVARGLLSEALPEAARDFAGLLSPELSPTEWRRGATSLAASIAVDPVDALARSFALVDSELYKRDPGLAAAMLWGLGRAADTEPEAAERLLVRLAETNPLGIAESLTAMQPELGFVAKRARVLCSNALTQSLAAGAASDDGLEALGQSILRELNTGEDELLARVRSAHHAFADAGSREAYAEAQKALAVAREHVERLERHELTSNSVGIAGDQETPITLLRTIDLSLFESGKLRNLLMLDRSGGVQMTGEHPVEELEDRVAAWLLRAESKPMSGSSERITVHQRRLRALLHVVDGEPMKHDDATRRARSRVRSLSTCRAMASRLLAERGSPLHRVIAATLARALDALVRDGAADASDVVAFAALSFPDAGDLAVLAEASMRPEIIHMLEAYTRLMRQSGRSLSSEGWIAALEGFAADIPSGISHRTDIFRRVTEALARALHTIQTAASLEELVTEGQAELSPIAALQSALGMMAQLTAGAADRCGRARDPRTLRVRRSARTFHTVLSTAAIAAQPDKDLALATTTLIKDVQASLPSSFGDAVAAVVSRIPTLRRERTAIGAVTISGLRLPAWVPQRRMLGGFYVHRRLGQGALGTVFEVSRAEERHNPKAERFALKVPEYNATTARSLSEAAFLKQFREEAVALLAIPEHPNLARFVTFDAGAKPKPVLVMELIQGTTCETLIRARALNIGLALSLLDGMLAGLEAMHSAGLAHLDLKPANIIVRGGREAVLVDFGLSGRRMRPGCGSGSFGAPEVWLAAPSAQTSSPPTPVDIYAFACVAYEVLTGETLFSASDETTLISMHLMHDGFPDGVRRLARSAAVEPVSMLLFDCLRHDPATRPTAAKIRAELRRLSPQLSNLSWPL